ncbi:hypothetical protein ARSEF1564_003349 [Beauveria bassiana]
MKTFMHLLLAAGVFLPVSAIPIANAKEPNTHQPSIRAQQEPDTHQSYIRSQQEPDTHQSYIRAKHEPDTHQSYI